MNARRTTVAVLVPHARPDTVPLAQVQGALALDLRTGDERPAPEPAAAAREEGAPAGDDELRRWSAMFAQAVFEATIGERSVAQLSRWTNARVYDQLLRRSAEVGTPGSRVRVLRPQIRSVHVFRPAPGCAEISAHVRHQNRSRALAGRLERIDDRWVCTALEIG